MKTIILILFLIGCILTSCTKEELTQTKKETRCGIVNQINNDTVVLFTDTTYNIKYVIIKIDLADSIRIDSFNKCISGYIIEEGIIN